MAAPSLAHPALKEKLREIRDRDLVLAVVRGDGGAFRTLYEAYYEKVYRQVAYLIGEELQVQDVLQSTFLKVFQGLQGFRAESSLTTWIYRIAYNECQDFNRRRNASLVPLEAIIGSHHERDCKPLSFDQHALRESQEIIRQAVMELPFKLREVVLLRYMEELSYDEIASVMGCSRGTVASRLSRALERLEERLGPLRSLL
jgi:RNA polymerase sigma-70 factor, ECF subfamily